MVGPPLDKHCKATNSHGLFTLPFQILKSYQVEPRICLTNGALSKMQ